MKNIKITENELIALIEKIVNEQAGGVAFGGFGENMGFSKPTDKYEDLNLEGEDIEDDVEEDVYESEIVERLRKRMGPQKFPKKVSETISEAGLTRTVTKWTHEQIKQTMSLVADNNEMITEIYNDMVERRDVAPPKGPQG